MDSIFRLLHNRFAKSNHEFFGSEKERELIMDKIRSTFMNGESNSMLILGKSGVGKTHLIKSILNDLESDSDYKENMKLVHLNGLLLSDAKSALASISRQLKVSLKEDEEITSESFNETFNFILKFLSSGNRQSLSVLFILEEFDLFLQDKNQILVYNLFNCAQTVGTPICVIGTTQRQNVVELMEKRVKSRFSHCQIVLKPYAQNYELYIQAAQQLLNIESRKNLAVAWNKNVKEFFEDNAVLKILERDYLLNNTVSRLKKILRVLLLELMESESKLDDKLLEKALKSVNIDYQSEILRDISELELTLLCNAIKCATVQTTDINFEIVYHEYKEYCEEFTLRRYSRNVVQKCMDNLLELDLMGKATASNVLPNYQILTCYVDIANILYVVNVLKMRNVNTKLMNYMKLVSVL